MIIKEVQVNGKHAVINLISSLEQTISNGITNGNHGIVL